MHIGLVAPVETSSVADLLGSNSAYAPPGYLGAPLIGTLARALLQRGHKVSLYTTDGTLLPGQREPLSISGEHAPGKRTIRRVERADGKLVKSSATRVEIGSVPVMITLSAEVGTLTR